MNCNKSDTNIHRFFKKLESQLNQSLDTQQNAFNHMTKTKGFLTMFGMTRNL